MAETEKTTDKYHGMKPFTQDRIVWGEKADRKKCRLTPKASTGNDPSFLTELLVLEGNEKPEKYILWLLEYNEKVFTKDDLSGQSKYNTLLELVKNNAKTLTRKAYNMASVPSDDVNLMFTNVPIRLRLQALSQSEWENYLRSEEYQHDIVTECITQVGAKIFGKDHAGSNAYIHLRRQIRELKVTLQKGIKSWEERIQDYQNYLPYCPWVSGEKLGLSKLPYAEHEMKEILETAILQCQRVKLNEIEWVIQDHSTEATITKLAGLEETLLKEARQESRTVKIEAKCGIASLKRNREGGNNSTPAAGGGDTDAKGKCKHCGKRHLGVCFLKDKGGGAGGDKSKNWTKKENKQYINQVIESKMGGTVVSDITEGSKSKKKKPNWAKGLTSGEQMYIMGVVEQDDVDIEDLDDDDINDYKKQARKVTKSLNK